jgi:uncharacterized heparinase superfamily protein
MRAQIHHALFGLPAPRNRAGRILSLATTPPHTPFLDPPAHVKSLDGARIELLSTPFDLGERVDWQAASQGPLFAYHLHQHEYLRLAECSPLEKRTRILDWIENHRAGIGWDPHPISLRLLCWGKLLLTPGALESDETLRAEMRRSMAEQADVLARGLEVRLQANHLLTNLIALVWTRMLLEEDERSAGEDHVGSLVREIADQIRPDGGHEERSPMYHSLLLENLLDLRNLGLVNPTRISDELMEVLLEAVSRMLAALDLYTLPDGRIALLADSAFDVAAEPALLRDYAARLGVDVKTHSGAGCLPQTGYVRLCAGAFDLLASVAGPSPAHQPGHAHCDALAFELAVDGVRLVTDTGLYEYLPGLKRDRARATASHATLQIDGEEQAEIWAAHRVGGRPEVALMAWDESGSAEATCRGWSRKATLHRRLFTITSDGVAILDHVDGPSRTIRSCFPIDPLWQVERTASGARAIREDGSGARRVVDIELPGALDWSLERAPYYPSFGCEVERAVLVGVGPRCVGAVTRFRRGD